MTQKHITIRSVLVAAMTFGLAAATALPAAAATSHEVVNHAAGNLAGEVWFNSGNHAAHVIEDGAKYGFNSFTLTDSFCGDGWGIGVEWIFGDQTFTHHGPADCDPAPEETSYPTGQAMSIMVEFNWRPYMWAVDGLNDTVYGSWQRDWMGSDSTDGDTDLFSRTSVHNDLLIPGNGQPTFTATMWPTVAARAGGPLLTPSMWRDLQERTPLPSFLTTDQRESMYKQLFCHALFARHPEAGGDTWEIESERPNIMWWRVFQVFPGHKCNWTE